MLEDILLSLSGYVGESIEVEPESFKHDSISFYSYKYSLKLKPEFQEYFSSTEKCLISQILQISSNVYSVNEFLKNVQACVYFRNKLKTDCTGECETNNLVLIKEFKKRLLRINPVGFYINAISNCIQEYMFKYLEKISQLEREIFENPSLPLTYILAFTSKPARVLNIIMDFIEEWYSLSLNSRVDSTSRFSFSNMFVLMEKNDNICDIYISLPCGCILDYFYAGINSGDPLKEAVYKNFLLVCNRVFSYQIVNWVIIGRLIDPFEEFIVGKFSLASDSFSSLGPETGYSSSSIVPADSCFETCVDEEDIFEFCGLEEAVHCLLFEWEGLFYTRYDSLSQKYLSPRLLYAMFCIGKTLRVIKRFGCKVKDKMFEKKLEFYFVKLTDSFDSFFPYIQTSLEEFVREYKEYLSSILLDTLKNSINGDCIALNFKLARDLYLLGNGDFFSQLDKNLFNLTNSEMRNKSLNISEQFECVKSIWSDLAIFNSKLGHETSTCGVGCKNNILDIVGVHFCSDTFDLFGLGMDEEELVDVFNCEFRNETLLELKGRHKSADYTYSGNEEERGKEPDLRETKDDFLDVVSYCKTKWPIRIIDGFNHVIECISSLDSTATSLLLTTNGDNILLKLSEGKLDDKNYFDVGKNNEFLRFTWFITDGGQNNVEFNIRVYWHTRNLRSLLNAERDYSLLKTNVVKIFNGDLKNNLDESNGNRLFSYRVRIIFKQSNISFYLEPYNINTADEGKLLEVRKSISLLNKPTQILNIQHINLDICLPLVSSSCYFYLIRHDIETMKKKDTNVGYSQMFVTKWCHISATRNGDIISMLCYSNNSNIVSYLDFSHSLVKDNRVDCSYYYDVLINKRLNSYISGINFNNHIFRLRLIENPSKWPFSSVFTRASVENYHNLFDFYWLFYRTYSGLERLWSELFNIRYAHRRNTYYLFFSEFPQNNFWNYISYCRWVLQVTVGEFYSFLQNFSVNQVFSDFLNSIKGETDFESLLLKHSEFTQSLILKSGLLLPSVINPLLVILVLTNDWVHSVHKEIARWNSVSDENDAYLNKNHFFLSGNRDSLLESHPWDSPDWTNLTQVTIQFMKNFILLWDSLCGELSIVANNIQYQHFSHILSIFNNKWNIDIPDIVGSGNASKSKFQAKDHFCNKANGYQSGDEGPWERRPHNGINFNDDMCSEDEECLEEDDLEYEHEFLPRYLEDRSNPNYFESNSIHSEYLYEQENSKMFENRSNNLRNQGTTDTNENGEYLTFKCMNERHSQENDFIRRSMNSVLRPDLHKAKDFVF